MDSKTILNKIDHTLLKPDATLLQVSEAISLAAIHNCRAVCLPPIYIKHAVEYRQNANLTIPLTTVVGFPLGYHSERIKWTEIREALQHGADEIDVVGPTYLVKNGSWEEVLHELKLLREAAGEATLKLIMETSLLSDDEISRYCELIAESGIDFAKTSSGFAGGGASVHAVERMRRSLDPRVKIKASGGIDSEAEALALFEAGADVLGMSRTFEVWGD